MDLKGLEKQRTELLQLLLLLIMIFLGIISFVSFNRDEGYLIPILTLVPLTACLYVIGKERRLKDLQVQLIQALIEKERQVSALGEELKTEQEHLEEEKDKSSQLDLRLSELTQLYRAIRSVNAGMGPKETLDAILRASLELVGAAGGSILFLDDQKNRLIRACSQSNTQDPISPSRQKIGDAIAAWVARHGQALLLDEGLKEEVPFQTMTIDEEDIGSAMAVPLIAGTRMVGVIHIHQFGSLSASAKKLSSSDLRLAGIFAQHATAAIENVQLRSSLQKMRTQTRDAALSSPS